MKEKLNVLLNNSYSPYSNFKVAAIVKMKDGTLFNGVNVENASYGATICAERSAILAAISNGYKKGDFSELHLTSSSDEIIYPCFICRQVMTELFQGETKIFLYSKENIKEHLFKELTPFSFTEEDLK